MAVDTDHGDDNSYLDNKDYDEIGFVATELADYASSDLSNDSDFDRVLNDVFSEKDPADVKQEEEDSLSYEMSAPEDIVLSGELRYKPSTKRVQFEPFTTVWVYNENNNEGTHYTSDAQVASQDSRMRTNYKNPSSLPIYRYGYSLSNQCKLLPDITESSCEYDVAFAEGGYGSYDQDTFGFNNQGTSRNGEPSKAYKYSLTTHGSATVVRRAI